MAAATVSPDKGSAAAASPSSPLTMDAGPGRESNHKEEPAPRHQTNLYNAIDEIVGSPSSPSSSSASPAGVGSHGSNGADGIRADSGYQQLPPDAFMAAVCALVVPLYVRLSCPCVLHFLSLSLKRYVRVLLGFLESR